MCIGSGGMSEWIVNYCSSVHLILKSLHALYQETLMWQEAFTFKHISKTLLID
jgi:hypothetical protein